MRDLIFNDGGNAVIGKVGENLVTRVLFPVVREWRELFGTGTFSLFFQRPGEENSYAVAVTTDAENVVWQVSATDLALSGSGECELRYTVGSNIAKSETFPCKILPTVAPEGTTPPTPWQSWVTDVLAAAETAEDAAESAEDDAETASDAAESASESAAIATEKAGDVAEAADFLKRVAAAMPESAGEQNRLVETATLNRRLGMELIASTTLSQAADSVLISEDGDGNAFNLSRIHAEVLVPQQAVGYSTGNVWVASGSDSDNSYPFAEEVSYFGLSGTVLANTVFEITLDAEMRDGVLSFSDGRMGMRGQYPLSVVRYLWSLYQSANAKLRYFYLSGMEGGFPAGTQIKVWGVRA